MSLTHNLRCTVTFFPINHRSRKHYIFVESHDAGTAFNSLGQKLQAASEGLSSIKEYDHNGWRKTILRTMKVKKFLSIQLWVNIFAMNVKMGTRATLQVLSGGNWISTGGSQSAHISTAKEKRASTVLITCEDLLDKIHVRLPSYSTETLGLR